MAINTKVMLNAIKHELQQRGRTTRLLPVDVVNSLFESFAQHGYVYSGDNTITNGNTTVERTSGTCGVKVVFTQA
jgi:hypothetical protein